MDLFRGVPPDFAPENVTFKPADPASSPEEPRLLTDTWAGNLKPLGFVSLGPYSIPEASVPAVCRALVATEEAAYATAVAPASGHAYFYFSSRLSDGTFVLTFNVPEDPDPLHSPRIRRYAHEGVGIASLLDWHHKHLVEARDASDVGPAEHTATRYFPDLLDMLRMDRDYRLARREGRVPAKGRDEISLSLDLDSLDAALKDTPEPPAAPAPVAKPPVPIPKPPAPAAPEPARHPAPKEVFSDKTWLNITAPPTPPVPPVMKAVGDTANPAPPPPPIPPPQPPKETKVELVGLSDLVEDERERWQKQSVPEDEHTFTGLVPAEEGTEPIPTSLEGPPEIAPTHAETPARSKAAKPVKEKAEIPRIVWIGGGVGVAAVLLAGGFIWWSGRAARWYAKAEALQASGQTIEAVGYYQRVADARPDFPDIHQKIGLSLVQLDRPIPARQELERQVSFNPTDPVAHYELGRLFMRQRLWSQAAVQFAKSLETKPDHRDALWGLSAAYVKQDMIEQAVTALMQLVELAPDYPKAAETLGNLCLECGRPDQAQQALRRAAEHDPRNADVREKLGDLAFRAGNLEEASNLYRDALTIDPNRASARLRSAQALMGLELWEAAQGELRLAAQQNPSDATPYALLAQAHLGLGNIGGALEAAKKAVSLDPAGALPNFQLARALAKRDRAGAFAALQKALAADPALKESARTDAAFASIRPTPQFKALTKK